MAGLPAWLPLWRSKATLHYHRNEHMKQMRFVAKIEQGVHVLPNKWYMDALLREKKMIALVET